MLLLPVLEFLRPHEQLELQLVCRLWYSELIPLSVNSITMNKQSAAVSDMLRQWPTCKGALDKFKQLKPLKIYDFFLRAKEIGIEPPVFD